MLTLHLSQSADAAGAHRVEATLSGGGWTERAVSRFRFEVSAADRERVRWYLEDFLEYPVEPAPSIAARVEADLAELGGRLFTAVFGGGDGVRLWARLQGRLTQARVEIASEVADAAALP